VSDDQLYGPDLARIHDIAFDGPVRQAAPHLLRRLQAAGIERGLVADLGCGGGIWAQTLVAAGYEVLGVDRSADAIAIGRVREPRATFETASLHAVELPRCAAVTALGEVFNYDGPESLGPLFARIRAALRLDGLLLFDLAAPGGEPGGRRTARHEGDGWTLDVEIEEDVRRRTLTRWIAVERDGWRSEEVHRLRTYPAHEVLADLVAAGFRPRILRGGYGAGHALRAGVHAFVASAA
jgi:SAM-dependent methyltransferase